jgi:hypothetical protein
MSRADSRPSSMFTKLILGLIRFGASVVCSAVLALWMQHEWRLRVHRTKKISTTTVASPEPIAQEDAVTFPQAEVPNTYAEQPLSSSRLANPHETEHVNDLNGYYSQYLATILHTLRSDRKIRMAKLELPSAILSYQRNLASTEKGGAAVHLSPRTAVIPVIAISRESRPYLEEMRITYIDPERLPAQLVNPANTSVSPEVLKRFILVPDLSGANSKKYVFGKN